MKDSTKQRTSVSGSDEIATAQGSSASRSQSSSKQRWKPTLVHGWISIAIWMTVGLLLEGLLGFKTPTYLQDDQRRELFRLAHTHGTFLGLVLLAAAVSGSHFKLNPPRAATLSLQIGATLMPIAFLLAGVWHYESDPGLAIWLVPPSALLMIFGIVNFAFASRTSGGE